MLVHKVRDGGVVNMKVLDSQLPDHKNGPKVSGQYHPLLYLAEGWYRVV